MTQYFSTVNLQSWIRDLLNSNFSKICEKNITSTREILWISFSTAVGIDDSAEAEDQPERPLCFKLAGALKADQENSPESKHREIWHDINCTTEWGFHSFCINLYEQCRVTNIALMTRILDWMLVNINSYMYQAVKLYKM